MTLSIRPITDIEGCNHFRTLERAVWAGPDDELVPFPVLVTASTNGGMLLGAYADDGPPETGGLVGAAFWWLGAGTRRGASDPSVKVCSHMLGVLSEWRGRNVGLKLKLAQRQAVLDQGLTDWITWTYDPLYLANGVFNIHRLGATCTTYKRNIYGEMQDALNAGVPSDRCQVDWWLNSKHVLHDIKPRSKIATWDIETLMILPTRERSNGFPEPEAVELDLSDQPIAVPVPTDIKEIRLRDKELSMIWRLYIRNVFETAFSSGYAVVDCVHIPGKGWHYILVREYI